MNDLEWYLDIGGKQSGPHAAKEIVDLVRSGRIPTTAQVTAARMSGDWVTAQDLVEAYDELYAKSVTQKNPGDQYASFTGSTTTAHGDPNFRVPPRPTEQLEKSKIINLSDLERAPDPTDALFQAIQAVREKAQQKAPAPSATGVATRDSFGQVKRKSGPAMPPQMILILTLAAIFGVTVYGISLLIGAKQPGIVEKKTSAPPASAAAARAENRAPRVNSNGAASGASLLDSSGNGESAARAPRATPANVRTAERTRMRPALPVRAADIERLEKDGGARYRDDRDPPTQNDDDVDEGESGTEGQDPAPGAPLDPAQVSPDRENQRELLPGFSGDDTVRPLAE